VSQFAGRSGKTVELSLDRTAEGGGPHVSIFQTATLLNEPTKSSLGQAIVSWQAQSAFARL